MTKKIIFLSYRRGDSPGYVKSLEKELEHYYGEGSVFRDVRDIAGGTKWKQVIEENLSNAAVLMLIIGPRWDSIWNERINDEVNYVEYELNYANDLRVPVIPVTLDGSMISEDTDLKSVSWLREHQQYDMSDKQGRWENDFNGLVKLLENSKDIDKVKRDTRVSPQGEIQDSKHENNKSSWLKTLGKAVAVIFVGLFLIGVFLPDIESIKTPPKDTNKQGNSTQSGVDEAGIKYRDISGTWKFEDAEDWEPLLYIKQLDNGLLKIEAPESSSGEGQFIKNMPNKIKIQMHRTWKGEFSISNTDNSLKGWIINGAGLKTYETLVKVSP